MTHESVRARLYSRVVERNSIAGSGALITDINNAIDNFSDLNVRAKDYAFRSCVEHRSLSEWAAYYHISYQFMAAINKQPRVQQLKKEIMFNIQKYTVGMKMFLLREAMTQYLKIFRARETAESLEPKRKAAKDVMSWFGMVDDPDGGSSKPLNVNIFNDNADVMRDVPGESMSITSAELEKQVRELRELEDLRIKVVAQHSKVRPHSRLGGGFSGNDVPDIEVE